ncbi:MAG: hypothetical protein R3E66_04770 [bacterium]
MRIVARNHPIEEAAIFRTRTLLTAALLLAVESSALAQDPQPGPTDAQPTVVEAPTDQTGQADAPQDATDAEAETPSIPLPQMELTPVVAGEKPVRTRVPVPSERKDGGMRSHEHAAEAGDAAPLSAGDVEWNFNPEYRVRTLNIDPLEINGDSAGDVRWTEQRFRMDTTVAKVGVGAIRLQMDMLDGVLFGDNGEFPDTNGVSLSSNRPNIRKWAVGLPDGADPLDRKSYVPVLKDASLIDINYLYADVFLPVGLLRVGRQPKKYGAGIPSHDGGPYNRWGVSNNSDAADRILFGTKLDEAFYILMYGYQHVADPSMDNGLIWALFYDWQVQDDIISTDDDLSNVGTNLEFRRKTASWLGLNWKDVLVSGAVVYLSNKEFDSKIFGFPASAKATVGDLTLQLNYMHINGSSREISEGFAELSGTTPTTQDIIAHGFQAIADYVIGPVTATMEFDLATGDDDPRVTTPITSFNFARDMNVGLLMFEHVLAFETARSAAVGIENLAGLDAASFPVTEVSTEGRFTNAIALFPQVKVDLYKTPNTVFHTRLGALFAWSQAPGGVVDPILTSLGEDGNRIDDDAVNFNGGRPDRFYGTELDLQLGLTYKEYFHWTVEGAMLMPGPALYDQNGDALNSFLVENRLEFRF